MTSLRSFSILITFVISFLLVISVITYNSLTNYIEDSKWVSHSAVVLKELETIKSSVKDAQISHRGFELTGDSSYLEPYFNIRSTLIERTGALDSLFLDQKSQRYKLDSLQSLIVRQFKITDEILNRRKAGGGLDRYGVNLLTFDEENMQKIRTVVSRMKIAENRILAIRSPRTDRTRVTSPIFLLISFISAVFALIYLFWQLYKTIKVKNATEFELEQNLKLLSEEVTQKEVAQDSLKKVLDSSSNGIMFLTTIRENKEIVDFKYNLVNRGVEHILSLKPEVIVGHNMLTVFPGTEEEGLFYDYKRVVETGEQLNRELFYRHEDLSSWFHVTAAKLDDGCVVTFTDITDRKLHERQLVIKNEELAESNKNLEQFAYVASHDLQEPLRKVRTFGDRVATKYSNLIDDRGKDYIKRMNSAAERMQLLIDDLLKYSRVARHPQEMKKTNIEEIIDEIKLDFETVINESKATINVEGLLPVKGDRVQLRQLFQNLISNAIKFTPEGKSPVISITGKKVKGNSQKDFNINSKKNYLRIEVLDNGIGFDQKYAERIFNIFERLHGKNEYKGTGIGLAICQKVVQNHNGYIRAINQDHNGAKFIIMLPIKKV